VSWPRVRGHDEQVRSFAQVFRRGRLAHAYLFIGPPGIGKRTFALELAKALLCEGTTGPRLEACDHCEGCLLVAAGTHPDLFTAARPEEKLELPIETIRELCRAFSLKPARGRYKVLILDDADDLTTEAANCFLKTLEEPPPRSVVILIGTSLDRQLPTILSRCQVVRFSPLDDALVEELLQGQELPHPPLLPLVVRLGQGSPGRARELADPALWEFRRQLLEGVVQSGNAVALAKKWTEFAEDAGKESSAQRLRAEGALRLLIEFLRDSLRLGLGGSTQPLQPDDLPLLQELTKKAEPELLIKMIDRCLESDVQIERRVQLVLVLEALTDAIEQIRSGT
jgi:DNA polymerase-3 subunit delta'